NDATGVPAIRNGSSGVSGTPQLDDNPLNVSVAVHCFRQSENLAQVAFTIQSDNKDLTFKESGGLPTARLNISAHIVSATQRRVGAFEDSVSTQATVIELASAKERQ